MSAAAFYDAARSLKRELTGNPSIGLTDEDVALLRAASEERWKLAVASEWSVDVPLTVNVLLEIISHEAIVQEAYLDSEGVWTWSVGITNATGHNVNRYKDNPQPLDKCLAIYIWALRERYVPAVLKAFAGHQLTEAQFTAALSFHYNTGAIGRAHWVEQYRAGQVAQAKISIMDWDKPAAIIPRREKERDLFFDGKFSNDGKATIYPVNKPSYHPDFAHPLKVDIRPVLEELLK
jgi:lysozyme